MSQRAPPLRPTSLLSPGVPWTDVNGKHESSCQGHGKQGPGELVALWDEFGDWSLSPSDEIRGVSSSVGPRKLPFLDDVPGRGIKAGQEGGCPWAQLPLMMLGGDASQGTTLHDLIWLYLHGGKFLPVGNVLLPLFLSSSLRTQLRHRDNRW